MVFLASFLIFLLFVLALSMSLFIKRKPLVSEDDARNSLLDDGNCAACSKLCALAGKKNQKPLKICQASEIPHKQV